MSLARIDAHQHFWRLDARRGSWPPASLAAIHRDFAPDDLRPALAAACVAGTVAVQSLPSLDDTRFLLDLAERETMILGVVGWADLKAPDAAVTIATLARHRALRGLRPMLQDLPERDWIDDPALGIDWPVTARAGEPLEHQLSAKDAAAPTLAEAADQGLLPSWSAAQSHVAALR